MSWIRSCLTLYPITHFLPSSLSSGWTSCWYTLGGSMWPHAVRALLARWECRIHLQLPALALTEWTSILAVSVCFCITAYGKEITCIATAAPGWSQKLYVGLPSTAFLGPEQGIASRTAGTHTSYNFGCQCCMQFCPWRQCWPSWPCTSQARSGGFWSVWMLKKSRNIYWFTLLLLTFV